ncbi:MAG: hypothetical protein AB1758_02635, partial [Candidatus Eremiobacterota bacterium]
MKPETTVPYVGLIWERYDEGLDLVRWGPIRARSGAPEEAGPVFALWSQAREAPPDRAAELYRAALETANRLQDANPQHDLFQVWSLLGLAACYEADGQFEKAWALTLTAFGPDDAQPVPVPVELAADWVERVAGLGPATENWAEVAMALHFLF